jgi:hypothetical protein
MLHFKHVISAVAVVLACAGVAVAAQTSETTPVTADFRAALVSQKERQCDATHMVFLVRFEGTQTSSDARLTGNFKAKARSIGNTQNGYGSTSGKVLITDPVSGLPKFRGRFVAVIEPDGGVEGLLVGSTFGADPVTLLANFNAQQDTTTGAIAGQLGRDSQTGPAQDPAILTNACRDHGDKDDDHHGKRHDEHGDHDDRYGDRNDRRGDHDDD